MKTIPLFQVDAFTSQPFSGNPAAVCLLDKAADVHWMPAVGSEMNLSETAFVWREADGFDLRWFTPTVEVDLCGHATLATAHILWQEGWLANDATARFYTRSGVLTAQLIGKRIVLDFPATPAIAVQAPSGLLAALGVTDAAVFSNNVDYLVLLGSEAEVRRMQVDFAALKACQVTRGIIVTAAAHGTEYDFVSRFFAPAAGIDEDPVTGSAHCTLAPFWASRLGKTRLQAYQASARGGEVLVEWLGERVLLAGSAVTVFKGELYV